MSADRVAVSVVMPFYNAASTLDLAIRSILNQTYDDFELILFDDGSTDESQKVARGFDDRRIRLLTDSGNRGLAARLNEAVGLARGEYVARMDSDDVSYPKRLERQLAFVRANPELDLVGCYILVFRGDGTVVGRRGRALPAPGRSGIARTIPLAHPTFFGRASWFRRHGYREWADPFQDQELLARASRESKYGIVPEILLGYREERISIRKQFRYRSSYFRAFTPLRREIGLARTSGVLALQAAKLTIDVIASGTGLQYRLLRHRAQSASRGEYAEWQVVWSALAAPVKPGSPSRSVVTPERGQ